MFTTWELIYSQLQHRQSLPLPRNRHQTVSNNVFRDMHRTIRFEAFHRQLFSYLRHRGIGTRTIRFDCYMDCSSANYGVTITHHHIGLRLMPRSAANTTGRSRTVLNRIVLVAERYLYAKQWYITTPPDRKQSKTIRQSK